MNATSVTEQVTSVMNRTNLLMYYTADEPDGSQAPDWASAGAAALINSLDPYRPSSLCLNCQDYLFDHYAAGTPILMADVYPIGVNPNYSVKYNTPCGPDQGDCGCDNCAGDFEDIRQRMNDFRMRLEVLGWERMKSIMTIPQGFGSQEYVDHLFVRGSLVSGSAGAMGAGPIQLF